VVPVRSGFVWNTFGFSDGAGESISTFHIGRLYCASFCHAAKGVCRELYDNMNIAH